MKSILITGGTGSFGQAFTRRLVELPEVERICIYSRGEHHQAEMRQAFAEDSRVRWFIGDVRDRDRLRRAMEGCEAVVHAAALKRIEVGHYNPIEMVKTNIDGTVNVIEAAHDAAVKRVVYLSTDKAWQPVSAYGQSKALAESLVLAANYSRGAGGPLFAVTRYGNVWGSKGSVVPKWRYLAANSGSVPVTDLRCTRFFMTMEEAVNLVRNTLLSMRGGELVIPEKLPAYQLSDLVKAIDAIPIVTGLPEHEKLHEGMREGLTSDRARRMSVDELRQHLEAA